MRFVNHRDFRLPERPSFRRRRAPGRGRLTVSMDTGRRILITGSEGLIGRAMHAALEARGAETYRTRALCLGCNMRKPVEGPA